MGGAAGDKQTPMATALAYPDRYDPDDPDLSPYHDDPFEEAGLAVRARGADNDINPASGIKWQFHSEQLRAFEGTERFKVLVAGRRWGKSAFLARWNLSGAMRDHLEGNGGTAWVVYPTLDMGRPLWNEMQRVAPPGWITEVHGTERQMGYIVIRPFADRPASRIEFKSAQHPERLVGVGLRRVSLDEAGIMPESVYRESIYPALMDYEAPALLAGTPKGKNWFYEMWLRGQDPLRRAELSIGCYGGPTTQNPFFNSIAEVEKARLEMPTRLFRQEILASFEDEGGLFRGIERCFPVDRPRRDGLRWVYSDPLPTVAMGVDLARVNDFTVIVGVDAKLRITYFDRFRRVDWPVQKERIKRAYQNLGGPKMLVDSTGAGDPVLQDLLRSGCSRASGFGFTAQSKPALLDGLSIEVQEARVTIPDEPVILNELRVFGFVDRRGKFLYSAPAGLHDDCVCALALAVRAGKRSGDSGITI